MSLNRKIAPSITHTADLDLKLKPYHKIVLDNGVEAYLIHAPEQEVLQIEWLFDAGNWYEPQNIVAGATSHLIKCGTRTMKAFDINESFEYHGAYLSRNSYAEHASISLHALSRHAHTLLPLVQQLIQESTLPEEELQLMKQNAMQRLRVNLKKCDFVSNRLIDTYLYGGQHPYGRYTSEAAYEAVTREQCVSFYEQHYQKGSFKIFAAGKLPDDIETLLNQHFGQHPVNVYQPAQHEHPATPADQKKYRIENDSKGVQGAIRIARPFGNRHHPDFMGCMVLNNIFGGFFGSRLMNNIREDKGYTYGIYSYMQNHLQQMAWMVSTEAGRTVCEATIEEVYKEMEELKTTLVDEEELLLVRNYMMGQLLGDLDGPFHLLTRWKTYVINGIKEDYFYKYLHTVKTISAEELQALAKKYLNPEEFYELVVV
jgi:zinc protease